VSKQDSSLRSSEPVEPEEFSRRVSSVLGEDAEVDVNFGRIVVRSVPDRVVDALSRLKSDSRLLCNYFTFLGGVDWQEDGFEVVIAVYSLQYHNTVILKVRLPRENPAMPSLTPVFRGANWYERETKEMFGIDFEGHPNLRKLLLSEDFEGHPLRKDFKLASRSFKPWPGAKDPGEAEAGGR
jgi:NADH-quinone oxidoreductase subunit C